MTPVNHNMPSPWPTLGKQLVIAGPTDGADHVQIRHSKHRCKHRLDSAEEATSKQIMHEIFLYLSNGTISVTSLAISQYILDRNNEKLHVQLWHPCNPSA